MWQDLRAHPIVALVVVALHLLFFVLLGMNFHFKSPSTPLEVSLSPPGEVIQAVAIDAREFDRQANEQRLAEQRQREAAAARERERQEAERRAQQERQRQQEAERRVQQERQRQEAERKAQQAREAQAAAQRAQQERERQEAERKAQQERQRQEAERKAQQEREAQAAAQRAQQERERQEAERRAQQEREAQAAAQRAQQLRDRQLAEYIGAVRAAVQRQWVVPPAYRSGYKATVFVRQTPVGYIQEVRLESCTGDELFCRSVEAAVRKAEPLPTPTDPALFSREIRFTFEP
ncbi:cell envelope integrity protein TolA [Thiorhodospira sibirica]|uniref:cell envelope integrity protein TolA n=1 Tax=Thiorhodospira sibirica TaxID=154347 RepID=UPI00022C1D4E|nr:cell envelope integrity protein TolA [Thiorhodospira sibirica]